MTTDFAPVDPLDAPLPGVTTADAWMAVLVDARDGGWLPSLLTRITAARPDDATLREAASLLAPRPTSSGVGAAGLVFAVGATTMAGVAAGGVVLAGLLVAMELLQESPPQPMYTNAAQPAFEPTNALSIDDASVSADPLSAEGLSLAGDGSHDVDVRDAAPADPDGDPVAVSAALRGEDGPPEGDPGLGIVAPVPRAGPHPVGYWYAGRSAPGQPGDVVQLDHMVNVRVDYPHPENQWNTGARILSVLEPGDRVRIRQAPITIEGGHVWVPLLAGDKLPEPGDGTAML